MDTLVGSKAGARVIVQAFGSCWLIRYLLIGSSLLLSSCENKSGGDTIVGTWRFPSESTELFPRDEWHYTQEIKFSKEGSFSLTEKYLATGRSHVGNYKADQFSVQLVFAGNDPNELPAFRLGNVTSEKLDFWYTIDSAGKLHLWPKFGHEDNLDEDFFLHTISCNPVSIRENRTLCWCAALLNP